MYGRGVARFISGVGAIQDTTIEDNGVFYINAPANKGLKNSPDENADDVVMYDSQHRRKVYIADERNEWKLVRLYEIPNAAIGWIKQEQLVKDRNFFKPDKELVINVSGRLAYEKTEIVRQDYEDLLVNYEDKGFVIDYNGGDTFYMSYYYIDLDGAYHQARKLEFDVPDNTIDPFYKDTVYWTSDYDWEFFFFKNGIRVRHIFTNYNNESEQFIYDVYFKKEGE